MDLDIFAIKAALEEIDELKDCMDELQRNRDERIKELRNDMKESNRRQDILLNKMVADPTKAGLFADDLRKEEEYFALQCARLEELEEMDKWASYGKLKSLSYYI